jgi:hypothetical protein
MREKELFDDVGLPTAPHEAVATPEELRGRWDGWDRRC